VKWLFSLLFILFFYTSKAGSISTNLTLLPAFGNVYVFHTSTVVRYTVSASSLTNALVITAPSGFDISLTYTHGYGKIITINNFNFSNLSVFVRCSPSAVGALSGNITHVSAGSSTVNVAVSGTGINWAIPANYYSTVNTQTGASLKTALYNKILGHTAQSYTPGIWNAYNTTDRQLNGKVWDIYSTRLDTSSPYEYTYSTDQCGTYSLEGDCYNREHLFPQSWFSSNSPMVSDLHHLPASDGKVNGMRSNNPFGKVISPTWTSLYGGKLGPSVTAGYTGVVFEPHDEYKGDIARAFFYMATRYENVISTWQNLGNANDVLDGTSYPVYDNWYINLLISWHHFDPVSDKEIKRNNAIFALQNNRNPFIDSPQFVRKIWGGGLAPEPTLSSAALQITNNSNTSVTLNWNTGNGQRRLVLIKAGSAVNTFPIDSIHYTANANLSLAPTLGNGVFVVYNGSGSSVTLTNLAVGTNYHYAIIEYNGWYNTTNYTTSTVLSGSAITLPVHLLQFTAQKMHKDVLLHWQTATEINHQKFILYRSYDGINYHTIASVKGAGNSRTLQNYQYVDANVEAQPTIIYKLTEVDFDGNENELKSITINAIEDDALNIKVSPNPFDNELRISVQTKTDSELLYSFISVDGKSKLNGTIAIHENQTDYWPENIHLLSPGIYFLQIQYNGRVYRHKLVKTQ